MSLAASTPEYGSGTNRSSQTTMGAGERFGVLTFVTDEGIGPAELGAGLEQRGFESLFLAEHTHIPVDNASPYPMGGPIPPKYYRTVDPFLALTAAAVATETLVLATASP